MTESSLLIKKIIASLLTIILLGCSNENLETISDKVKNSLAKVNENKETKIYSKIENNELFLLGKTTEPKIAIDAENIVSNIIPKSLNNFPKNNLVTIATKKEIPKDIVKEKQKKITPQKVVKKEIPIEKKENKKDINKKNTNLVDTKKDIKITQKTKPKTKPKKKNKILQKYIPKTNKILSKEIVTKLRNNAIYFDSGSAKINENEKSKITKLANLLKNLEKKYNIIVAGHADSRGSEDFNRKLSIERAENVKNSLLALDIPYKNINSNYFGEKKAVSDKRGNENFSKSRRVEIFLEN